jgi:predicted PurR-regulated permease PerM
MSFPRPIVFWVAVLAAVLAVVILLREVLLPFVAGIVLAYLLDPLAARIERLGMNRLLATLVIIAFVVVTIAALMVLTLPVIIRELAYFIESFPLYVKRLHTLAADPSRPWLSKIIEEGQGEAERSLGELASLASSWSGTFLRSVWSGGRALISIISLGIVAPIVAFYLLYDWDRMIAAIDNWVPPATGDRAVACA